MIPQPLTLIFPLVATALIAWLRDARLPRIANYAIIAFFFALSVFLCIVLGSGLTGDPGKDVGIIIAECAAVFAVLKPLMDQASTALPSPLGALAARAAKRAEMQREVEAMWTAARASVPPRASAEPRVIDATPPPTQTDAS